MKKLLTLLLTVVMACACCFGLTACGDDDNNSGIVDITDKTITVGYTDYPPMNYTENGIFMGFDTELALMVFSALGYDVRFKLIDWNQKYNELNNGTIDCIWNGFTCNVADDDGISRADKVDFSYNYMENGQCIVKLSTTDTINDWADFEGKSVSYELSSAADTLLTNELVDQDDQPYNVNKKGVTSQMDAIMAVKNGTANYAVVDILLARSICGEGDYENLEINEGLEIPVEYYAIGFKKDSELVSKVNIMLKTFALTGQLQELAEKYELADVLISEFPD